MACMQKWGIGSRLIIAGEGSLLDELRRHADELAVTKSVTFAGAVDTESVAGLLAEADVFCFPSRWEGQGNALLEAMASGCPVVASDIAPIREVLGDAGILVTPEDPVALAKGLRRVAEMSESERADLGRKARVRAENRFDARSKVRDLETFYRGLLYDEVKRGSQSNGVIALPIDSAQPVGGSSRVTRAGTLRVLQVVTDRDRRGGQVFATDLAPALKKLGTEVRTIALATGSRPQLDIGVFGRRPKSLKTLRSLREEAMGYDMVIAHGSTTLAACAIGLFGTKVPFVYRQISDPLYWARSWSRRLRVAAFLRAPKRTIALSSATADLFAQRYWLDRRLVSVSPNAVPLEHFSPATDADQVASRVELGLPLDVPVVAYVGALVAEKGVDISIQALRAIDPSVVLAIAGHGPEESALKDLARTLGDGRIRFLGALASPLPIYHAADVVVLPSRGGDSMPACLIEAGLCGLATVTTSVGAIVDVVVDGVTGYVVQPNDGRAFDAALARLLSEPDARDRFGRAARARCVEHFTIDAVAPSWLRILEECVDERRRSRDAAVGATRGRAHVRKVVRPA
jgi:glycosyltransferase involved in cell wall biosynthesis